MVGLNGKVDYLQAFVVGNFVEDGSHTVGNLVNQYGLSALRQPHYVVLEVVGCVPCGVHPYVHYSCPHLLEPVVHGGKSSIAVIGRSVRYSPLDPRLKTRVYARTIYQPDTVPVQYRLGNSSAPPRVLHHEE